jgi:uncharacterized membrane protein
MNKDHLTQFKRNFAAGLALILPAALSIWVVVWLFGIVLNFTDTLLLIIPRRLINPIDPETREIYWYWRLFAFTVTIGLIAMFGRLARNYVGKKLIQIGDATMLRIPLLNKIYGAIKQVNEAFTKSNKSSFKQVVLVEFPRPGVYSVGFITGEHHAEVQAKTKEQVVSVFIPTTPNPTNGYLVLVPTAKVIRLEMPVSDGVKFIISLGSVSPAYTPGLPLESPPAPAPELRVHGIEKITSHP